MIALVNKSFSQIKMVVLILAGAQIESLSGGKSMESIKSAAISDAEGPPPVEDEKWYHITIQVFIPFMIAGIGTIGAGIILGDVEVTINLKNHLMVLTTKISYRTPKCFKTFEPYTYWYLLFWV